MTRRLVALVVVLAVLAGAGAYALARGGATELAPARAAGAQQGAREGSRDGERDGYRLGKQAGIEDGFDRGRRSAYQRVLSEP